MGQRRNRLLHSHRQRCQASPEALHLGRQGGVSKRKSDLEKGRRCATWATLERALRGEHARVSHTRRFSRHTSTRPALRPWGCGWKSNPHHKYGVSSALARERICAAACRLLLPGRRARPGPHGGGVVALQAREGETVCGTATLYGPGLHVGAGGRAARHRGGPRQEGAQGQREGRQQRLLRRKAGGSHQGECCEFDSSEEPLRCGAVLVLCCDAESAAWCVHGDRRSRAWSCSRASLGR